VRRHL